MTGPWRIAFTVPEAAAGAFAEVVGDHADAVATFELEEGGDWLIEATSHREPDHVRLKMRIAVLAAAIGAPDPEVTIEALPTVDWLTRSYSSFPPIRAGRYFIHGSHHEGEIPVGAIGLHIDAATAFGSGEHGSTRGCLLALDRLARRLRVRRALDMGCGSGILAIAVAKTWRVPVIAVDIDEESVRVTRENAAINRVDRCIIADGGDGYATPIARKKAPYDLIAANILARPLAKMAPDLARHLAPGGYAVLAGLIARQERHVLAAHRAQGLRLVARIPMGEWRTLVLRR